MYSEKLSELEVIKNVENDFFKNSKNGKDLNCNKMLGNIDFCVSYTIQSLYHNINFLWAEAKKGNDKDIIESLIQLILTIGKEKTYSDELPPAFLGAFDCEKIAFIEYHEIQHIFSQNDFNWNVAPSNHESKEFKQLYSELQSLLDSKKMLFFYDKDNVQLKQFIESNFVITNKNLKKIQIDKNNFIRIYLRWLEIVKPSIMIDWELEKPYILDSDFFIADVLSRNNDTQEIMSNLRILLQNNLYKINIQRSNTSILQFGEVRFNDKQVAHKSFWNLYERPPKEQYWDYIIKRRDLLVPQDIRERKGSFFTPQVWVSKAQDYLQKALGEDYQSKYYIWDLAAGSGNLLAGLQDKYRIYASTLDESDVKIMHQRIENGANLLPSHVFEFDFLNDCFFDKPCPKHKMQVDSSCKKCKKSKVPQSLQKILKDSNERKKLIIFINPPYAEATTMATLKGTKEHKGEVARENEVFERYKDYMGGAINEVFAQFFFRIYKEISGCVLASFSTLKYVNSGNFVKFRETFKAKFLKGFICPAYTFDNVQGKFPIGFLIWNLDSKQDLKKIKLDVYNDKDELIQKKKFYSYENKKYISKWISNYYDKKHENLGYLILSGTDVRCQSKIYITSYPTQNNIKKHMNARITSCNIIPISVYFAVRHCIKFTWINHSDQFLEPKAKWIKDSNFANDCLAYMLFSSQNKISTWYIERKGGYVATRYINHFLPFSESEINAKDRFDSHFMYDFLQGKIKVDSVESSGIKYNRGKNIKVDSKLDSIFIPSSPLVFSQQALAVFNAGREVFKYYHSQDFSNLTFHYDDGYDRSYNPNASLYDIKAHFQGFSLDSKGNPTKMNALQKCKDSHYADLITALNTALDELALNIESKTYEYEFLIE